MPERNVTLSEGPFLAVSATVGLTYGPKNTRRASSAIEIGVSKDIAAEGAGKRICEGLFKVKVAGRPATITLCTAAGRI